MWRKIKCGSTYRWTPYRKQEVCPIYNLQKTADLINSSEDTGDYSFDYENHAFFCKNIENKIKQLPANIYRMYHENGEGTVLIETELSTKEQILPTSLSSEVIKDFNNFTKSKKLYSELNMPFRQGVLLFGPPGTGKTCIIHDIITKLKTKDVTIILAETIPSGDYLVEFRKDKRLKVIVFEEFTNCLNSSGELSYAMLDFLDGENSTDNVYLIATTNYPERLPRNVTQRPGRFDRFYKIGYLKQSDIKMYLSYYNIKPEENILKEEELTIAQLKELVLLMKRDKKSSDEALSVLQRYKELAEKEFNTTKASLGFIDEDDYA